MKSKGVGYMLIENNTVAAHDQMINSSHVSFFGDPKVTKRILVVGNSITRHGPNAEIGWGNRDWGMAASAPEKDFVHLLYTQPILLLIIIPQSLLKLNYIVSFLL